MMTIELTNKNKQELIEKGGTFFDGANEQEYKILCQKADTFLATHRLNKILKNAFKNGWDE